MKKLLMICLFLVGCSGVGYVTKYPVNDHYRSIYLASVAVCDAKGTAVGAATIIENEGGKPIKMITAGHVVTVMAERDTAMYACYSYGRKQELLVPVKVDLANDIALVRTAKNADVFGPHVRIAAVEPKIGDPIVLIGSPMGHKFNVTTGIVSNYITDDKTKKYRVDAAAFYGNSGGGAFNDDGELEGVLVGGEMLAGLIVVPGGAHVVALPHLRELLK